MIRVRPFLVIGAMTAAMTAMAADEVRAQVGGLTYCHN